MAIYRKINAVKSALTQKAKETGLYENFGQTEVRKLYDDPRVDAFGTTEQRQNHAAVSALDDWAMNYEG